MALGQQFLPTGVTLANVSEGVGYSRSIAYMRIAITKLKLALGNKNQNSEMKRDEIEETLSHLAEDSGMDVSRCEFCDKALDERKVWRRGIDGAGAHKTCIAEALRN